MLFVGVRTFSQSSSRKKTSGLRTRQSTPAPLKHVSQNQAGKNSMSAASLDTEDRRKVPARHVAISTAGRGSSPKMQHVVGSAQASQRGIKPSTTTRTILQCDCRYWASFVDPSKTAGWDNEDRSSLARVLTMRTTTRVTYCYLFIPCEVTLEERGVHDTRGLPHSSSVKLTFSVVLILQYKHAEVLETNQATLNSYKDDVNDKPKEICWTKFSPMQLADGSCLTGLDQQEHKDGSQGGKVNFYPLSPGFGHEETRSTPQKYPSLIGCRKCVIELL